MKKTIDVEEVVKNKPIKPTIRDLEIGDTEEFDLNETLRSSVKSSAYEVSVDLNRGFHVSTDSANRKISVTRIR